MRLDRGTESRNTVDVRHVHVMSFPSIRRRTDNEVGEGKHTKQTQAGLSQGHLQRGRRHCEVTDGTESPAAGWRCYDGSSSGTVSIKAPVCLPREGNWIGRYPGRHLVDGTGWELLHVFLVGRDGIWERVGTFVGSIVRKSVGKIGRENCRENQSGISSGKRPGVWSGVLGLAVFCSSRSRSPCTIHLHIVHGCGVLYVHRGCVCFWFLSELIPANNLILRFLSIFYF